ncbi:MAG: hypothetical protein HQL41_07145 [Alphaproteobacteria bacterium]|nr:hypothetical protein [Alphaproteobacteria bacterium]
MKKENREKRQLSFAFQSPSSVDKSVPTQQDHASSTANITSLEAVRRMRGRDILVSNLRESGLLSLRNA